MSNSIDTNTIVQSFVATVEPWISAEGIAVKVTDLPEGVPAIAFRTEAGPCILTAYDATVEQRAAVVEALSASVWELPLLPADLTDVPMALVRVGELETGGDR